MSMTRIAGFLLVFCLPGSKAKKIEWPASIPAPYALFRFDEGHGLEVENDVCVNSGSATTPGCGEDIFLKSNKGVLYVQDDHQPNFDEASGKCDNQACHPGANWVQDDHFGNVLNCGNGDTQHKDAIRLPDLDYGSRDGKWAFNIWVRHSEAHKYSNSEMIVQHGAADESTSSRNYIFMNLMNTGYKAPYSGNRYPKICLGVFDGDDPPYCDTGMGPPPTGGQTYVKLANCVEGPLPEGKLTLPKDAEACDGTVECWTNPRRPNFGEGACCCKTEEEKAKDPNYHCLTSDGPKGGGAACTVVSDTNCTHDDNDWHMLTLTTSRDAPGWRFYIDGVLRASNPNVGPGTIPHGSKGTSTIQHVHGGSPINPKATINVCGRDQSNRPDSGPLDVKEWHPDRYYLGKVAHFAIVSDALSEQDIQILFDTYKQQFGFDQNYPDCLPPRPNRAAAPAPEPSSAPATAPSPPSFSEQTASGCFDMKIRVVLELGVLALAWMAMLHHF